MPVRAEIGTYWSGDRYALNFFFVFAVSGDIPLRMVSLSYLQAQLDLLRTKDAYTQLLIMEKAKVVPKTGEGEPPAKKAKEDDPSTSKQDPASEKVNMVESIVKSSDVVQGRKPSKKRSIFRGGKHLASIFGLKDMGEVMELQEYLELNGNFNLKHVPKDGSCFFRSVLEQVLYPAEYQYMMLKRQMVLTVTEHPEFFFEALYLHIKGIYGVEKLTEAQYAAKVADGSITQQEIDDQDSPGPFSFVTYLEYLLKPNTWGDHSTIMILSMMWQVKITVVNAEDHKQQRFRHDSALKDADIVLVFCGGYHYVPAGEERR